MEHLVGRVAFVTGGASGIGYAIARALLAEGMRVVVTDVDEGALDKAAASLRGSNAEVFARRLDVTDRAQYAAVAEEVWAHFGAIHVLCNNAGVYRGGSLDQVTYADWDWVLGVNVGGVVNGLQTLLPRMRASGEAGHIVNTASMAGIVTSPGLGVYNASKFAVVGLSESLKQELAETPLGVSVLCPGMVRTAILESERTRPEAFDVTEGAAQDAAAAHNQVMQVAMNTAIEPAEVGELVVRGIREDRFYLFPHPEFKGAAQARASELLAAFGEPDPERMAQQAAFMADLLPSES